MIRIVFIAAVVAWSILTLCVVLASAGVMNPIGFYGHVIPATFIDERLGPTGEVFLSTRPFVGSGHGPPHLAAGGLALVYGSPLIVSILIAHRRIAAPG
jgi:hypothetical protein